ncbi:MAG: HK97 family phage prohead protease [Rickettsiaceae bacterium]|nr:HK97 family phage prohead protease [Rickettsiaceae bacterium]
MQAIDKNYIYEMKTDNSSKRVISGYASVFDNKDAQGDIVLAGAFGKNITEKAADIKFLWQHNPYKPIGIIKTLREDNYGLYVEAELNESSRLANEATALIKQGALSGLSIGFKANKTRYNKKGEREILALNLLEISIVTFPANPKAKIGFITKSFSDPPNLEQRLVIAAKNINNLTEQLTKKIL